MTLRVSVEKAVLVVLTASEVACAVLLPATFPAAVGVIVGVWFGWWLRSRRDSVR